MKNYSSTLLATLSIIFICNISRAQTVVWTNTASGGWNTAVNWSPNTVPNSNNAVIINQPGITVSLNGSTTAGSITIGTNSGGTATLSLTSQTLTLYGPLSVKPSGSFTVDSGTLSGSTNAVLTGMIGWTAGSLAGVLTVANEGTLNITGSTLSMSGAVLTNNGTVLWTNGTIQCGSGSDIENYSLWNMTSDQNMNDAFGGSAVFNNHGTLRKSGGGPEFTSATLFQSGVVFNQLAGVIDVQNGTGTNGTELAFQGGGTFTGGYITTNQYGLTVLSAGNFTVNGTVTGTNTWEDAANLVGTNVINGALTWVGGNWNSASSVTITPSTTLYIVGGSGNMNMDACQLTNNGTVQWISGTIEGGGGSTINNAGLWNMPTDQNINDAYGGGTVFNNYGTLRKSGGGPEFTSYTLFQSGVVFNQIAGVIDVQNGTGTNGTELAFQGGGTFTGGYITTNQYGLTVLSVGNFTVNGTVTGTNTWEDAGNLVGTNVINGALTWVGGNWNSASSVTITPSTTLYIVGGSGNMNMDACQLTNNGTVQWISGTIEGGGGSSINNAGLWNMPTDQNINDAYGGGTVFNNYGTLRKSGGGPEFTSATLFQSGVVFNQLAGVIDVQNGTGTNGTQLGFQGGGTFTGGYITTNQFGLTVLGSGGFNINGTVTGTNTWEDTGTLTGANVINGALTWVGGSWNSATSVTIITNSTLIINTASGSHTLDGCNITNNGTVNWRGDELYAGGGASIYNYGLWNAQDDQTLDNYYGGAASFYNYGTFRKSGGTNSSQTQLTSFTFNQVGLVDAEAGNLVLAGTENFTGGSTSGSGTIWLSSGNFTINGTTTGSNVVDNPGAMVGVNVIQGALTWQKGPWSGAVVTVNTNSVLDINTASGQHLMDATILTNYGTVNWSGDELYDGNGSAVYNFGLWNAQDDQIFDNYYGGSGAFFYNYGTFRKSGGLNSSQTQFTSATFNQVTGLIDVQTGNLVLAGTENLTGGSIVGVGTTWLSSGSFTLNGTVTSTNLIDNPSTMVGVNVIRGGLTWQKGPWTSAVVTVTTNSVLDINTASGQHLMDATILTNNGTVNWSGDELYAGNASAVYNFGLWNAQDDQIFINYYGGAGALFNNAGTFRKTGSAGGSTQFQSYTFTNTGTLDSQIGNISLQGTYDLTNGTINTGINGLTNYGTITLSGAAALTGTITANLNNFYQPSVGNAFTNILYGSFTGSFSSAILPALDTWTTNYTPTHFYLQVTTTKPGPVLLTPPQISGGNFTFSFGTVNGDSYTVQDNTNLETTNWVFYTNFIGNGSLYQLVTPVSNIEQIYFRVRQP